MDMHLLEIANKALSESVDRLTRAKEECAYWADIIAAASAPVPEEPLGALEPVKEGMVGKRRRQEQRMLNDASGAVFREVLRSHPGITRIQVLGNNRMKEVVAARNDCIAALRDACPAVSVVSLGKFFGLDHTSILYHLRKYQSIDRSSVQ